jgi:hypothetical protein
MPKRWCSRQIENRVALLTVQQHLAAIQHTPTPPALHAAGKTVRHPEVNPVLTPARPSPFGRPILHLTRGALPERVGEGFF